MNFAESLNTSITALKTNKLRSLLTMLGVIIGVASVILLISIGTGLKTYITKQLEDLGAGTLFVMPGQMGFGSEGQGSTPGAGVSSSKFTFSHLNEIKRRAKSLKVAMAYTENNGKISYKGKSIITQITGTGIEYPEVRNQRPEKGSYFNSSQYSTAKRVAVLGNSAAEELFGEEDPIGKKITISDQRYIVIGVLEEKGAFGGVDMDKIVYIPTTTAMRHFDMDYIQSFWLQSKSSETVEESKEEVKKILLKYFDEEEFSILDTKSLLGVISNVLGILTAALSGIAAISLIVGGIGIMNIMLVSVTERTREIGLRKAVGATPQAIMTQFLAEAVILSFLGGSIGVALGVTFSLIINRFFTTTITAWSLALAFGVSTLVGIIFGVLPARKAAKLNPIEALRYE